jgi:uncharacterized protein YdeI (YjbR/CyaY-like superfamily)
MDVKFFRSSDEFRAWLEENHAKAQELWLGFFKKSAPEKGITYQEAVDQALCFGWIDGVRKRLDEAGYTIRLTPRKPRSIWSAVNIKRFGELAELGWVRPPGLHAFDARDQKRSGLYSYEQRSRGLDDGYQKQMEANEKAWGFFQAQPPWYQRTASWWVMSAKKEETRLKRLATLIEDSENGRTIAALTRQRKN